LTFKDLKWKVSLETTTKQRSKLFERLHNKPFWIWNVEKHKHEDVKTKGNCCFNHIIGLPAKEQMEKPIYDNQKLLHDSSLIADFNNPYNHDFKHKHLQARG